MENGEDGRGLYTVGGSGKSGQMAGVKGGGLPGLTGWAVQARYPGHSPEPSAVDAVCVVDKVSVGGFD